ncbi:MAG: TetR/AcrR family transcriptional regulator [Clostridiales bacterium]|nr:TetR/AcrR family transcriptional regulator [Clostridiales bacterium]
MANKKEVNKKEDLRIRRTRKLLCDAMFSLLEEKSFDDISVVEICDRAMVHRATFYKHFEDKYTFMEYVTKEKIREFYEQSTAHKTFNSPVEIYNEIIANVMHFIEENKNMLRLSMDSARNNFFDSIEKIIAEEIKDFLDYSKDNGVEFPAPTDISAQFLTGGFCSIIRWWLATGQKYSKQEMTEFLMVVLTKNDIYGDKKDTTTQSTEDIT